MLVEERRQKVLELVGRRGFIALADLAQAMEASESTIRRDLEHLHQQGVIKRTHGGAIFLGDGLTLPALEERTGSQVEEKKAIARATVNLVENGDAILLDGRLSPTVCPLPTCLPAVARRISSCWAVTCTRGLAWR